MALSAQKVSSMLALGDKLGDKVDNITRDYESLTKRMAKIRSFLQNKNVITYDVFRGIVQPNKTVTVSFSGNTIIILQGSNLEISFNEQELYFPWEDGDPIDDFPFYQYKIRNTGVVDVNAIILTMLRGSI